MEESRICRVGVKPGMLHHYQSNDIPQCNDSNYGSTSNNSVEEDESSNITTKSRDLLSPVYCTQESREEPPGPGAGTDPSGGQQDSECRRNKEKILGNNFCSGVDHFHMVLVKLIFSAAQVMLEHDQF